MRPAFFSLSCFASLWFQDPNAQAAAEEAFKGKEADLELWRKDIKSKGWKAFHDFLSWF